MFRALTQSDNTCNDIVLRHAGGPDAVRAHDRPQPASTASASAPASG